MFFEFLRHILSKVFFFTGSVLGRSFEKPLSKAEETRFLALAKAGDKKAKDTLVLHNMRLVAHIAKKYQGAFDQDDLISVGSIGLIKAINTFEPGHGTVFSSYSSRCIENEILMLIRANKKHKNVVSLSDPVGSDKDGNELTLSDLLYEKEDNVFEHAHRAMTEEKFLKLLKAYLTEREFTVISMRFGLNGAPMPQREVAKALNISRSYISRIEKKAVLKLRENLKEEDFI